MKKLLIFAIIIATIVSCKKENPMVTVDEFAQKAPTLVDCPISIKGTAMHVCHNSGRRLFLGSTETEEMVTVVACDSMPNFDVATEGKIYAIEGIVRIANVISNADLDKMEQEIKEIGVPEGEHICATEQKAEGVEIAENEENPQLVRINALREQIKENNGEPLTFYNVECTSFKIVEEEK